MNYSSIVVVLEQAVTSLTMEDGVIIHELRAFIFAIISCLRSISCT